MLEVLKTTRYKTKVLMKNFRKYENSNLNMHSSKLLKSNFFLL